MIFRTSALLLALLILPGCSSSNSQQKEFDELRIQTALLKLKNAEFKTELNDVQHQLELKRMEYKSVQKRVTEFTELKNKVTDLQDRFLIQKNKPEAKLKLPDVISAQKFRLVDKNGKVSAAWGTLAGAPFFSLSGTDDAKSDVLLALEKGKEPYIRFRCGDTSKSGCAMRMTTASQALIQAEGKGCVANFRASDYLSIGISDKKNHKNAKLFFSDYSGPGFEVKNETSGKWLKHGVNEHNLKNK